MSPREPARGQLRPHGIRIDAEVLDDLEHALAAGS